MCHDQGEHIDVSGLGTEVVPVFSTHSQRTLFTEARHALQGEGDEFSDLENEDMCDLVVQWNGRIWVYEIEALDLLDDVSGDWDWRSVPCCC